MPFHYEQLEFEREQLRVQLERVTAQVYPVTRTTTLTRMTTAIRKRMTRTTRRRTTRTTRAQATATRAAAATTAATNSSASLNQWLDPTASAVARARTETTVRPVRARAPARTWTTRICACRLRLWTLSWPAPVDTLLAFRKQAKRDELKLTSLSIEVIQQVRLRQRERFEQLQRGKTKKSSSTAGRAAGASSSSRNAKNQKK